MFLTKKLWHIRVKVNQKRETGGHNLLLIEEILVNSNKWSF